MFTLAAFYGSVFIDKIKKICDLLLFFATLTCRTPCIFVMIFTRVRCFYAKSPEHHRRLPQDFSVTLPIVFGHLFHTSCSIVQHFVLISSAFLGHDFYTFSTLVSQNVHKIIADCPNTFSLRFQLCLSICSIHPPRFSTDCVNFFNISWA